MNQYFIIIFLILLSSCNAINQQNNQAESRPNIIFLITDDQARSDFNFLPEGRGKEGTASNLTPTIDKLHQEGLYFSQMYCASTVCAPSRFNCMTGLYASRSQQPRPENDHQVRVDWATPVTAETTTLPELLQQNGYLTGLTGKIHAIKKQGLKEISMDADPSDPEISQLLEANQQQLRESVKAVGYDYAASIYPGNPFDFKGPDELRVHNLEWIFKGAFDFLDLAKQDKKPFFLWLSTTIPHVPLNPERSFLANPLATPAGYLEDTIRIIPPRHQIPQRLRDAGIDGWINRKANLTWLDDCIGALMNKLEETGFDENTIIFYFNDHGTEPGGKGSLYQNGVRSIAFAWAKQFIKGQRNTGQLVQNIDFTPTILELAGMKSDTIQFDGVSFYHLLNGEEKPVHQSMFFEMGNARAVIKDNMKYFAVRHPERIRNMSYEERKRLLDARREQATSLGFDQWPIDDATRPFDHIGMFPGGFSFSWKAMELHPFYFDNNQLYDLNEDPEEKVNLFADSTYLKEAALLKAEMDRFVTELPGRFGTFGNKK